jgi:hypothetical protein
MDFGGVKMRRWVDWDFIEMLHPYLHLHLNTLAILVPVITIPYITPLMIYCMQYQYTN